jgi:hypothetical protein
MLALHFFHNPLNDQRNVPGGVNGIVAAANLLNGRLHPQLHVPVNVGTSPLPSPAEGPPFFKTAAYGGGRGFQLHHNSPGTRPRRYGAELFAVRLGKRGRIDNDRQPSGNQPLNAAVNCLKEPGALYG